ncbi:MAG: TlpA disulfide reductase family protein [Chitinophagales bacterium]
MKNLYFLLLAFFFLAACNSEQKTAKKDVQKNIMTTNTAIDSTKIIVNLEQMLARLEQKNDTVYVYNFWATWCKPCVEELPYFEQLQANYKDKKLKVVLVSLDFAEDVNKKVIPFMKKKQLKSEVLLLDAGNPNDWIDKISTEWSGVIPATLIVAKNGTHHAFFQQEFDYESLEEQVLPLF